MSVSNNKRTPGDTECIRMEGDLLETTRYSDDRRLNRLLETVVEEVKLYAEGQISQIRRLTEIGIALSSEKNINRLLEMIVDEARNITRADAGTLYILDADRKILRFEILQNDSMKTRLGGASGAPVILPPIPLEHEGEPNLANVSSYVALTGEIVNIPDVYKSDIFDFTGPRKYDLATGYLSKSMLVMPMKNHENDIIGVLQLLNALSPERCEIIPFSEEYVGLVASLTSQAAVSLTNVQLIQELQDLFYAFIKSIATAIDAKSPYTGGHIRRVVELSMMLAHRVNDANEGFFADFRLDEDQMEELRLAAWMHDIGKITTPEHVVDKRTKLECIFDRIGLIKTRFELIGRSLQNAVLQKKIEMLQEGKDSREEMELLDRKLEEDLSALEEEKRFLVACNTPQEFMSPDKVERLKAIGAKRFVLNGEEHPYLTPDEIYNLSILKGTLTLEERRLIENHTEMTLKILEVLPFPKKYGQVPIYAASHHEKVDGSGYPRGLSGDDLPIQARIMAIADIFEALTARDRPYKTPMKLSQAVKILEFMKKDKHIDSELFQLFVEKGIFREYAERELDSDQID